MTIFNYTVNYIDIVLGLLVIIAAVRGYMRGFFETVVRFIRSAVGYFLCIYLSNNYSGLVYTNLVRPRLLDVINEKIVTSGNVDEVITNLTDYVSTLPGFVQKYINTESINISSGDISNSILENIFEPVAMFLTKIGVFVAVFVVFFTVTELIIAIVKWHNKKKNADREGESALKKTDRFIGLLFGLFKAFLLILVIATVFGYLINANDSSQLSGVLKEAQSSAILNLVNEINPFNAITEGLI